MFTQLAFLTWTKKYKKALNIFMAFRKLFGVHSSVLMLATYCEINIKTLTPRRYLLVPQRYKLF